MTITIFSQTFSLCHFDVVVFCIALYILNIFDVKFKFLTLGCLMFILFLKLYNESNNETLEILNVVCAKNRAKNCSFVSFGMVVASKIFNVCKTIVFKTYLLNGSVPWG